jgi:hypothetical protein
MPTGTRGDWIYSLDKETIVNEQFGFVPHCALYRERSRSKVQRIPFGTSVPNNGFYNVISEQQYLLDRTNGDRRRQPDNGANMTMRKLVTDRRIDHNFCAIRSNIGSKPLVFVGPLIVNFLTSGPSIVAPPIVDEGTLMARGAELVSRALPSLPSAGVGQMLAELKRDGLPRASIATFRSLKGAPRGAADDFLNYQFGWKPLVSDIHDTIKALKNHNEIIRQWTDNAGKPLRRRREIPTDVSLFQTPTTGVGWENASYIPLGLGNTGGFHEKKSTVRTWFSGEFTYNLPIGDDLASRLAYYERLGDKLLGIVPTPELLWEISPWSWLVDWFTNVGSVIQNWQQMEIYGTVMRYGYVMHEIEWVYTRTVNDVTLNSSYTWAYRPFRPLVRTDTYVHRYRRKANPYGFGVTWESLNNTQLAILAALGMSRGERGGD